MKRFVKGSLGKSIREAVFDSRFEARLTGGERM